MARVHIPDGVMEFPQNYVFRTYAGAIGAAADNFSRAVYEHTKLSLREMEAARYRTALINGCLLCKAARAGRDFDEYLPSSDKPLERAMSRRGPKPTEQFYETIALGSWRDSSAFTSRERLAIEYAERLGERPQSMQGDEEFWASMREHFSDAEVVDLTLSTVSWIAIGRAAHALEVDAVCLPTKEPVSGLQVNSGH